MTIRGRPKVVSFGTTPDQRSEGADQLATNHCSLRSWEIYALKDPETQEVRYIGWTAKGTARRLSNHISEALTSPPVTHKRRWILSLLKKGVRPATEVLESGFGNSWEEAECRWIAIFKSRGARLVNGTAGGQGGFDRGTPEERSASAKKAAANRTPENRSEGVRKANAVRTAEQRKAISKIANSKQTRELRVLSGKKAAPIISAKAKQRWSKISAQQRTEMVNKRDSEMTPEQRSERSRRASAVRTAEERQASAKKMWETRRKAVSELSGWLF